MKMVTDVEITDEKIKFRLFGQLFEQPYYVDEPDSIDADKAKALAITLKYMAITIERQVEFGIPCTMHYGTTKEINVGFDVAGRVILPEGEDDRV